MNSIYVVNPETRELSQVEPASFTDLGIKEREDLEQWVIHNPDTLGEPLFVIASEFDGFVHSSRRLDILAIDKNGSLVVVELKLNLSHSYADQQAIRYAAFCSTMTAADVIAARARFAKTDAEIAAQDIREFLQMDLPELDDRPRVILAAGFIDDQELTATVLWLRSFGLDISCVELTPYRLPGAGTLLIAPRVIIPLPEAREHSIRVEQKEAIAVQQTKLQGQCQALWTAIADCYSDLNPRLKASKANRSQFLAVRTGNGEIHYEWIKFRDALGVALHFEARDESLNEQRLALITEHRDMIAGDEQYEFVIRPFGKSWACAEFRLPYDFPTPPSEISHEAARLMTILIDRTWPVVEKMIRRA